MPATISQSVQDGIRRQLCRILESLSFHHVGRLRGFLECIVDEMLAGRGDQLKEFPIGVEAFGKPSFDPRMDPLVGVHARRVQGRLFRYDGEEAIQPSPASP
jgi:hypothetical protein